MDMLAVERGGGRLGRATELKKMSLASLPRGGGRINHGFITAETSPKFLNRGARDRCTCSVSTQPRKSVCTASEAQTLGGETMGDPLHFRFFFSLWLFGVTLLEGTIVQAKRWCFGLQCLGLTFLT